MFWTDEKVGVSYEKREDGILLRRVKNIGMIYDMTIAADPAYNEASVSAREAVEKFMDIKKKVVPPSRFARERRNREMELNNFNNFSIYE